jgi:hypothetical protein
MQPALVISLYQVTEGFHAFTAVVMIFTLLWIGKIGSEDATKRL